MQTKLESLSICLLLPHMIVTKKIGLHLMKDCNGKNDKLIVKEISSS